MAAHVSTQPLPPLPACGLLTNDHDQLLALSSVGSLAQTRAAGRANPIEQGPFAPVIRGNPWGLDKGVVNDDWPFVIFDWDNHFGAYMLSLDAKEQGYSALIQYDAHPS